MIQFQINMRNGVSQVNMENELSTITLNQVVDDITLWRGENCWRVILYNGFLIF